MNEIQELVALLKASVLFCIISIAGGVTRLIWYGYESPKYTVGSIVIAAFSGLLVYLFATWLDLPVEAKAAIAGVSGFAGVRFLEAVQQRIMRRLEDGNEAAIDPTLRRKRRKEQ